MWTKLWNSIPCLKNKDCLKHQVASESVHGADFAMKWIDRCEACLEENNLNKPCKCTTKVVEKNEKDAEMVVDNQQHGGANSSFLHSVINMIGMLIGLGQLSTPYAIETGGWVSSFLLVGLGIICAYSAHLLGKCLDKSPKTRNYTDIGHQAFGTRGKTIAAVFIYMEIFMALVSYTISLHDNLNTVFLRVHLRFSWAHNVSTSQILTLFAVLVALPSLWLRNLSSISFLSTGGILMSLLIFVTVFCTGIFGGISANQAIPALRLQNISRISGLYIFSYAGHIVFPNIHRAMKDPSKFTKVSIVSFTFVTLLYTSLAFMGAKLFGPEVNPQITLSMPRDQMLTKFALWATVLTPMSKYALEFAPFAMQLEHALPCSMKSQTKMIIRGCIGSFLLLLILALALSVPYFEYVLGLTGSLVSVGISLIFPCVFYLKIFWTRISKPVLALNISIIILGIALGVSGTISSLKLLIDHFNRVHST